MKKKGTGLAALVAILAMGLALVFSGCSGGGSSTTSYTVTVTPSVNGTVEPSHEKTVEGTLITLTITPDEGYELDSLTMDGKDVTIDVEKTATGYTYTFNLNANVTFDATFKEKESETPPGGTAVTGVTLSPTTLPLTVGATATLTATVAPANATNPAVTWASSNTAVATVANGVVTAVSAGTATITVTTTDGSKTATCIVTVSSAGTPPPGEFDITVPGTIAGGSITADVATAAENTTVTLIIAPAEGYELDTLSVTGDLALNEVNATTYTFEMPGNAVTVSGSFTAIPYAITVTQPPANGSITGAPATATVNQEITLTVSANPTFRVANVSVQRTTGGATVAVTDNDDGTYTFTMPAAAVTVSAIIASEFDTLVAVSFDGFDPKDDVIDLSADEDSLKLGDSLSVTVTGGTVSSWILNGEVIATSGATLDYTITDLPFRAYTLTAIVEIDGIPYSKTLTFTVER